MDILISGQLADKLNPDAAFALQALLVQPLAGPDGHAAGGCNDQDSACLRAAFDTHPVRALAWWQAAMARPLTDRIAAAPAELVDYVRLDNLVNGYAERPRAVAIDPTLLRDATQAFAGIPPGIRAPFDDRLAGIYFLENLGSTGYTEYVTNAAGERAAAFIVLDAAVLRPFMCMWC